MTTSAKWGRCRVCNRALHKSGGNGSKQPYCREHGAAGRPDSLDPLPDYNQPGLENLTGVSTYVKTQGGGQWIKSGRRSTKADELAEWAEAFKEGLETIKSAKVPEFKAPEPKKVFTADTAVYTFGDPHFGLYCSPEQVGHHYDLGEAHRLHLGAFNHLSQKVQAETGLILLVGDTFHADDQTNATPRSKNQLDVSARYKDITLQTLACWAEVVHNALEVHPNVDVWIVPGNHDPHASWYLSTALFCLFSESTRVNVNMHRGEHFHGTYGKNLIVSTHFDKVKTKDLGVWVPNQFRQAWGIADYVHVFGGHYHHRHLEVGGLTWEICPTLAPSDSHAYAYGYKSGRSAQVVLLQGSGGEIARHRVYAKDL
jgi:hypothetical protein